MDIVDNILENNQIISNEKSNDYRCGLCDKIFSEEASLRNHIVTIHKQKRGTSKSPSEENPKSHFCDLCDKSYKMKRSLERHLECFHGCRDIGELRIVTKSAFIRKHRSLIN